jgi:hypothetical protein
MMRVNTRGGSKSNRPTWVKVRPAATLLSRRSPAAGIDGLAAVGVGPWIRGYMHTLRLLWNEAALERATCGRFPPHVAQEDLALALFYIFRLLSFWLKYRSPRAGPSRFNVGWLMSLGADQPRSSSMA